MKKFILISTLLCAMILLCACNNNAETEEPVVTEWKPSTSATKENTEPTLQAQEEDISIKSKFTSAETQEETEETETELPTQGVPNPNGHIPVTTVTGSLSADDLNFVYKNKTIKLYDKIENVFKTIGEDNSSQSISDNEMQYEYEDFILTTYTDKKGVERLTKILVTDENYSTQKGVKVGNYASSLKEIYGNPASRQNSTNYYGTGSKQLIFKHKNNRITEISYEYSE